MATLQQNPTPVLSFNREETKKNFIHLQYCYMENIGQAIEEGQQKIWSRQKVNDLINQIRSNPDGSEHNQYGVICVHSEEKRYKLILKNKQDSTHREIVPYEDCFDVVLTAHRLFGHRCCKKTYKYISKKYVIHAVWLELMSKACNLCESRYRTEIRIPTDPKEFKECYLIFNVAFGKVQPLEVPNEASLSEIYPYESLLIVVDKFTNFVYLRPLCEYDEYNAALELFKIFADHGVPKMIETSDLEFYKTVSAKIANFMPNCHVPVSSIAVPHTDWVRLVEMYLQDWMEFHDSRNWLVGSQSVQWNMNNMVRDGSTPFEDVFKCEPIQDLMEVIASKDARFL